MFSTMKYLFLYCYEASEKMEEKAKKFEEERAKRMESFRADREAAQERARKQMQEVRGEVRGYVKDTLDNMGVATKDEVADIKILLADLAKKVDRLSK